MRSVDEGPHAPGHAPAGLRESGREAERGEAGAAHTHMGTHGVERRWATARWPSRPRRSSPLAWRCARRRTPSESPRAPSASPAPRPARRGPKKRKGHRRLHDTVELAAEDSADVLRRLERVEIAASARTKARKGRSPARKVAVDAEVAEAEGVVTGHRGRRYPLKNTGWALTQRATRTTARRSWAG